MNIAHEHAWPGDKATRLEWALFYAQQGWRVFPLAPYSKVPTKGSNGLLDATTDTEQIRAWWTATPKANIGIATGAGLQVVDEDPDTGGDADALLLPPTLTAFTWSGGRHFYYTHTGALANSASKIAPGIDTRGDGGYVVAPPSIVREKGAQGIYRWDDTTQPLATLPARIVAALTPREKPPTVDEPANTPASASAGYWLDRALSEAREGTRNTTGLWLACQLRDSGISQDAAEECMREYANRVPGDGYTAREALATLKQAYRTGPREPAKRQRKTALRVVRADTPPPESPPQPPDAKPATEYRLTEYGNTDRLLSAYGSRMRWTREFGWVTWDGRRWVPNGEMQVREWAKHTVRSLYAEAAGLAAHAAAHADAASRRSLAETSEDLLKWATRSETDKVTTAMVNLAASASTIAGDEFDQRPWLFNCANGTIDLTTGRLRAPDRADLLMQTSPIAYDPDADCPTFKRFLYEIMCEREELVSYLQRALGYSLTGDVREQVWHLCVGEGANGKSTLFETLEYVLGDYAAMVAPETITLSGATRDAAAPSPDIARLKGKRFAKITETEEGARIAPARIKSLTGGDMIMGRLLHHDIIEFRPTLKIWVYTNHRPQVRETTHAFWRRVRYIPFDWKAGDNPDPSLPDRLRAEAPGILAWLVQGCLAWQEQGLNPPVTITDATVAYRDEQDTLRTFLGDRCEISPNAWVTARQLYAAYTEWCEEVGERPQSQKKLSMSLQERGFQKAKVHAGWAWFGVGLLSEGA